MSFPIFDYNSKIEEMIHKGNDPIKLLRDIQSVVGAGSLPEYLIRYVARTMQKGTDSIAIHPSSTIENYTDAEGLSKARIERTKGFMGQVRRDFPNALHHFKIFFNKQNKARLFYKFNGNISFVQNVKNARRV